MPIEEPEVEVESSTEPPTWRERWDAQSHANEASDAIVAAAWIQSQQIRRQAETEGHTEGYADGYADGRARGKEEGHAEGLAAAQAEGAEALHAAIQVANSTELDRSDLLKAAEGQLVTMVIAVA